MNNIPMWGAIICANVWLASGRGGDVRSIVFGAIWIAFAVFIRARA